MLKPEDFVFLAELEEGFYPSFRSEMSPEQQKAWDSRIQGAIDELCLSLLKDKQVETEHVKGFRFDVTSGAIEIIYAGEILYTWECY